MAYTIKFKKDFLKAVQERQGDSVSIICYDFGFPAATGCKWAHKAGLMKGRERFIGRASEDPSSVGTHYRRRMSSLHTGWEFGPLLNKWQYWTPEERAWFKKEMNCE